MVIVSLSLVFFGSCEKSIQATPDELVGSWIVNEVNGAYDGLSYESMISVSPQRPGYILVANFLDTANDPETSIENFILSVKVEGNRLIVEPQTVDVVEILSSSGVISNQNQFRIEYNYRLDGGSYRATAYFFRK